MKNISVSNQANILNDRNDITSSERKTTSGRKTGFSPSVIKVICEGGENFFLYLKRHDISRETNLLVLPSAHHYYYDEKELANVRTLVNLKKLNQIKDLDGFCRISFRCYPRMLIS